MLFKSMFWLSMSMATLAMALPDLAARDATVCGKVEIRARPGTEFAVRRANERETNQLNDAVPGDGSNADKSIFSFSLVCGWWETVRVKITTVLDVPSDAVGTYGRKKSVDEWASCRFSGNVPGGAVATYDFDPNASLQTDVFTPLTNPPGGQAVFRDVKRDRCQRFKPQSFFLTVSIADGLQFVDNRSRRDPKHYHWHSGQTHLLKQEGVSDFSVRDEATRKVLLSCIGGPAGGFKPNDKLEVAKDGQEVKVTRNGVDEVMCW